MVLYFNHSIKLIETNLRLTYQLPMFSDDLLIQVRASIFQP